MKTSSEHSISWAKSEFLDATSYMNVTLDCTQEDDALVKDQALRRLILSYGLISIKEEKIEYVGANLAKSFVLFDASD